jgi:hypothetical protein
MYDGDTVSARGVFTKEANDECERLIKAKTMFLNQSGGLTRKLGNEAVQSIYSLTRDY